MDEAKAEKMGKCKKKKKTESNLQQTSGSQTVERVPLVGSGKCYLGVFLFFCITWPGLD